MQEKGRKTRYSGCLNIEPELNPKAFRDGFWKRTKSKRWSLLGLCCLHDANNDPSKLHVKIFFYFMGHPLHFERHHFCSSAAFLLPCNFTLSKSERGFGGFFWPDPTDGRTSAVARSEATGGLKEGVLWELPAS